MYLRQLWPTSEIHDEPYQRRYKILRLTALGCIQNMPLEENLSIMVKNTNIGISNRRMLGKEHANRQQDSELEFTEHQKNNVR